MPISTSDRATGARPPAARTGGAFVWVWLPDATEPVVADRMAGTARGEHRFAYGESHLARPAAISLFTPELPLTRGWIDAPDGLDMARASGQMVVEPSWQGAADVELDVAAG